MRRDREHRLAAACAQLFEVVKIPERCDVFRRDVEQNDIRAFEAHLRGGNEKNSHPGRIRENFRAIEERVVQCNREHAKAKRARPFEKLVRRVIEGVLRIVERMDMEIELDPIVITHVEESLHRPFSILYLDFCLLAFLRS